MNLLKDILGVEQLVTIGLSYRLEKFILFFRAQVERSLIANEHRYDRTLVKLVTLDHNLSTNDLAFGNAHG